MKQEKLILLVSAAQQGNTEALNELFNTFYNDVYYFALKTLNNNDDLACDITQETFVEAINTIGDLRQPGAFVTWIKKITYHQCTRYFKKKKELLVDEGEDSYSIFDELAEERSEFIPNEAMDQEDFRNTILEMIDTLPEAQRSAIMLYYYDELTTKTISEIQNISEGTVKSRLNYARKAIKRSVEDYEKKNGVRLHSVAFFPLMAWLFSGGAETVPAAALPAIAEGITAATGTAITIGTSAATNTAATATATAATAASTATGTGILAKITAIPLATKIIAGVTAATLIVGGVAVTLHEEPSPTEPPTTIQTEETTIPPTTEPPTTEPTVTEPPLTEPTVTEPLPSIFYVPEGCKYIMVDGTVLTPGEAMPSAIADGDEFITEDYTYKYGYHYAWFSGENWMYLDWEDADFDGWAVAVNETNKTKYQDLLSTINGAPLVNMANTFDSCGFMLTAPAIPDSVENLDSTFADCRTLTEAPVIPDGITSLSSTFCRCIRLTAAPQIPKSVTTMNNTFRECGSLKTIPTLPESIIDLTYAFSGCSSLVIAPEIPSSVKILNSTFMYCRELTTAPIIPVGIEDLSDTFYGCKSLTSIVVVHTNPTSWDGFLWETEAPISLIGSSKILHDLASTATNSNVTVPETKGTWGDTAQWQFMGDTMTLDISGTGELATTIPTSLDPLLAYIRTIRIKSGITEFTLDAFEKFTSLITLDIPDTVTDIYEEYPNIPTLQRFVVDANNAYYCSDKYSVLYNKAMTAVDRIPWGLEGDYIVPSSVTYLNPAYSMRNCHGLTNIYVGPNVTDLDDWGDWEYFRCNNLLGIWVDTNNPDFCNDEYGVLFTKDMTTLLRMPQGFEGDYVIPTDVKSIGFCAFDSCSKLSSLSIPDGVDTIQQYAFFKCSSLTSLTFPASVTSYGWYIVEDCISMKEIRFWGSPGWRNIDTYRTFNGCSTIIYYPADNPDWSKYSLEDIHGLTWIPY